MRRPPPGRAPDDTTCTRELSVLSTGLLRYARVLASCTVESGVCGSSYIWCGVVCWSGMNGASPGGLVSFVFFISPSCA